MDFITYVGQTMIEALPTLIAGYEGEITASSLSEMEKGIKEMGQVVGKALMKQWLEAQEERYPESERACRCGGQAKYVRRREGVSITLQGRVSYRRTYYLCPGCGTVGDQTRGDERRGNQAGCQARHTRCLRRSPGNAERTHFAGPEPQQHSQSQPDNG